MSAPKRLRLVIEASSLPRSTNLTPKAALPTTIQRASRSIYTSAAHHRPLPNSVSPPLVRPNRVSSHFPISRISPSSPFAGLSQRIREASTSTNSSASASASPSKSAIKTETNSVEDDVDSQGDKKKETIKIGEVKRLMVLAKPERKTIGIAIGLVS